MADIITYPENGITYDADDASGYLATRQSGVYSAEEDFAVTPNGDLTVTVGAGQAWVRPARFRGRSIIMEQPETLTLPAADTLRGRIDRIVLRYDAVARKTSLLVLTGTPDSTAPAAPEITRTALIYDLGLATVTRPAGSTAVTAADLTDTRADETVCGVMRDGVTGIPTAQLLAEARARIALVEETASNSADAADKSQRAAAQNQADAEAARDAAASSAKAAGISETNAGQSAKKAAASEGAAKQSEDAAAASEKNASASEKNAAASEKNAATSEANALKYSQQAGAKAGTDKTFTVEDAPADAKAVGEALEGKSPTDHTHDYAGSDIPGGAATSAAKLNSSAGSATQPVYFSDGKPAVCTYTLGKSVPSNAVFTDHTYSAATQSAAGLMSAADKKKLDGVSTGGTVSASGNGYIRFSDGTQICWNTAALAYSSSSYAFNFPVPFANTNYAVAGMKGDYVWYANGNDKNYFCFYSKATSNVRIRDMYNDDYTKSLYGTLIVIGRWK